jgi:hypothetical protein
LAERLPERVDGRLQNLRESESKPKPTHPRDIFNSLPKPPGINDLYASQAEVLDGLGSRGGPIGTWSSTAHRQRQNAGRALDGEIGDE